MMDFRSFKFKYKFMPRNVAELNSVKSIINEFKFHMHPELSNNKFFLIYPADFNIVYYFRGGTNNFVHKIGRCVLTDMGIEYGSGDYTSFTNGDVIKKAKVTPSGIPPFTKPINNGTELQEQNGVMAPKVEANKYSKPYSLFRDK